MLNAQLQAVISLASYATDSEDTGARGARDAHGESAAAMLASFDTGYWTYYALPRDYSDLDYQTYVVQLLTKLAPEDPRFADASKRFATYKKQPPAFKLGTAGVGQVRFWLSKPSTVSVTSAAGPSRRLSLGDGWHTLAWPEPKRPGIYAVKLSAVDRAGNQSAFEALPIVRAVAPADGAAVDPHDDCRRAAPPLLRRRCRGRRSGQGALGREARAARRSGRDRLARFRGRAGSRRDHRAAARARRPAGDRRAERKPASGRRCGSHRARRRTRPALAQQAPNVQRADPDAGAEPRRVGGLCSRARRGARRRPPGRPSRCGGGGGRRLDRAEGDRRGARACARWSTAGRVRVPAGERAGDRPLDDRESAAAREPRSRRRSGLHHPCSSTG